MNVYSQYLQEVSEKVELNQEIDATKASLVLCFGAKEAIQGAEVLNKMRQTFNQADIVLASTAGEIHSDRVFDGGVSISAFQFDKVQVKTHEVNISDFEGDSQKAGEALVNNIAKEDLTYLLLISDGAIVNGSKLLQGITSLLPEGVSVSGGMAADADRFESTLVGLNREPSQGNVVAVTFYGPLKVSHASFGGWETFGLEKEVTKSDNNVLYEISGENALTMYKEYLGPHATDLPGSALLFPLHVTLSSGVSLTRTILSIDEENQSMVFAGDIPEGSKVKFMRSSLDRLIEAAGIAADQSISEFTNPKFALLVSCVGRKLVLSQRIEEEVEAVADHYNSQLKVSGFYSYGEFSPMSTGETCQLHNQTMTITIFDE